MKFNIHKFLSQLSKELKSAAAKRDLSINALSQITGISRRRIAWYFNYEDSKEVSVEVNPRIGELIKLLEAVEIMPSKVFQMLKGER